GQSRSPPAGGETTLRKELSSSPMRASGPTKKRSIIAPSSAPSGGTYPYPLCRFATSPLDKGRRPPEGKAFRRDRPLDRHGVAATPTPQGAGFIERELQHPPPHHNRKQEERRTPHAHLPHRLHRPSLRPAQPPGGGHLRQAGGGVHPL